MPKKKNSTWANILLTITAFCFWLIIAEIGLRVFYNPKYLAVTENIMGSSAFRYDSELGWFPTENHSGIFTASRPISYSHNSLGFRDIEIEHSDKPSILFIGDSFTWGFDAEQEERFTNLLSDQLAEYQVFNAGVNGFGTDQQFLLLKKFYAEFDPDYVFLTYFSENDRIDNSSNVRHGGYYKPYFLVQPDNSLALKGAPVYKGENYFYSKNPFFKRFYISRFAVRAWFNKASPKKNSNQDPTELVIDEIHKFVTDKGARLIVGYQSEDAKLVVHLEKKNIPHINLTNDFRYETFGGHWTPEGHEYVAKKIHGYFLQKENF